MEPTDCDPAALAEEDDWSLFERLLDAAKNGRAAGLRNLLRAARKSDSTCWRERYDGIAYAATTSDNASSTLQVLLDDGWDINAPSSWIDPPCLGERRVLSDEALVHWFLEHGAKPDASAGKLDVTPLSIAVQHAPLKIVELLIRRGGKKCCVRGQLANYATERRPKDMDNVSILRLLYANGAPMDNLIFEDHPQSQSHLIARTTPLMNACYYGDIDVVQFLLECGANVWKRIWIGGETSSGTDLPIDLAWRSGSTEIVDMLAAAMKQGQSHL